MGIGTGIAVAGGIAGSIGGAAIASHGAGKAADTQAAAADRAAQLQHEDAQASLDFTKKQWETQQNNLQPWLTAGTGAINTLTGMLPDLTKPYGETWSAPTGVTEQNDPGFQARLDMGAKALQASKAASGDLLSGGTAKALNRYAQDYASNEYSNVYGRAFNDFTTKYNIFKQQQSDTYNKYAGIAGVGQNAATTLGQEGSQAANTVANINLSDAQQQAQQINNAAAARASGYIGGANAWSGAFTNTANSLGTLALLGKYKDWSPS
jgi:hypothetical protein